MTPGAFFAEPRLAAVYDALEGSSRTDLDPYFAIVDGFGPASILDLGCGTGTFACALAQRGIEVVAADPAAASVDVARRKPGAEHVRWLVGDAAQLPALKVEMVTMTGNVIEHLDDAELHETFRVCNASLVPGGHIAFGSRNPSCGQWWLDWDPHTSARRTEIPGVGVVQDRLVITDAGPRHFSFGWTFIFESDNATYEWSATFPLRTPAEVTSALIAAGFEAVNVREHDDLFVARRPHRTTAP